MKQCLLRGGAMTPRILPLTIPLALLLACGAIEKTHGDRTDGGTPADAATGPSCLGWGALPVVTPSGKTCPPNSDTKKCVEEGWSCVSTWWPHWPEMAIARGAPFQFGTGYDTPSASPIVPVYLDAFQMDTYEVSNADFAAAIAGNIVAPPTYCDLEIPDIQSPDQGTPKPPPVHIRSGWRDGKIDDAKPDRPVSCITRASAKAYCESKGGRLPTAFEFAKATRALAPDVRPFPAHPFTDRPIPYNPLDYGIGAYLPTLEIPGFELERFNAVTNADFSEGTKLADDRSPWGIANLLGNASEHLCSCAEERTGFSGPLVRPATACKARCETSIATGGANVSADRQNTGAAIGVLSLSTDYNEPILNSVARVSSEWRYLSGDSTFNEHHDPRIGFRCVYPLK